ncbi:MAG: phosphatase PAP2 family protein [Chromatiaceae bacterium]
MRLAFLYLALAFAVLAMGGAWVCPGGLCAATGLDRAGLALANAWRGESADRFFAAITWLGSLWVLVPLFGTAGVVLYWHGRGRVATFLLLSLLGAAGTAHLFKLWIARPRPDLYGALTAVPADASYPSAHTMQAVAAALAILLALKDVRAQWGALLLALAALVGWSRVHLQVHFPTDVIAGGLAAALWVAGLHRLLLGPSRGPAGL